MITIIAIVNYYHDKNFLPESGLEKFKGHVFLAPVKKPSRVSGTTMFHWFVSCHRVTAEHAIYKSELLQRPQPQSLLHFQNPGAGAESPAPGSQNTSKSLEYFVA